MDWDDYISQRSMFESELENELHKIIDGAKLNDRLAKAINHSQFPPGKMIRPIIALSFCADLGGDPKKLLPAAAALELLHTSSLIHDDLPAMDDDDMRRGRPSCHKAFDEATAILAGDALVALAHKALTSTDYSAPIINGFVRSLSGAYLNLCDGQQLDLLGAKDMSSLEKIHRLKTAALFATAFEFGALGANCSEPELMISREAGEIVGLTFQIVDDYLDLYTNEKGRSGGSDVRNDKITFTGITDQEGFQTILKGKLTELNHSLGKLSGARKLVSQDINSLFKLTYPVISGVWAKIV